MRYFVIAVSLLCVSCSHSYYIVRHAEKEDAGPQMSSDVQLTRAGRERAEKIRDIMINKKIRNVYSTNFIRTKSTAQRTADYFSLPVILYGPRLDSTFLSTLQSLKSNTLIVGHSNTVDDIVNALLGQKKLSDLNDSEYNHLFIVKKKGKKVTFREETIY